MSIEFDPINKRVILDSVSVSATEVYSRSADWLAIGDNAKYGAVFRQVGGDDLGSGLSIPPYFFLQGDWRVRPMESDHDLDFTGNLFVEGGGNPFVRTVGTFQVNVRSTVPMQAQGISTSGAPAPTASQNAAAVWSQVVDGLSADDVLKVMLAALAGKTTGIGTTTESYLSQDGSTARITATFDSNNNRSSVDLNVA
jgi:hypothetical protein